MVHQFNIENRGSEVRRASLGRCIYCGAKEYRENSDRKLGDEHVIAEGLGGSLVLQRAACEACERLINLFERPILKTVLYVPRVHLGVRRKKRKRGEDTIKLHARANDKEIEIVLPLKHSPVSFFLLELGPPGILVGRPDSMAAMRGAWVHFLTKPTFPAGLQGMSSPVLDTFKFSQFLAKIAHSFAVSVLGDDFTPLLLEMITSEAGDGWYRFVGGMPNHGATSEYLHELSLDWTRIGQTDYAVVSIRLFASLGAPTYLVVVGTAKAA